MLCLWFALSLWKPQEGLALSEKMCTPNCPCAPEGFLQIYWHGKVFPCRYCDIVLDCFYVCLLMIFILCISEDEILCTCSSSSPLALLISSFGIEDFSFLDEVNANDGALEISGYISSPYDSISVKVKLIYNWKPVLFIIYFLCYFSFL